MRVAGIAVVAVALSACALTKSSGPNPSQPMCMPCTNPCYPGDCVARPAKAVAAAAAPTFTPAPGSYTGAQQVTLASATPSAKIHYTTDGSVPTAASPVYTGPIPVSGDTAIRAVAVAPGLPDSSVTSGGFYVSPPPAPVAAPAPAAVAAVAAAPALAVMGADKIELKETVLFDSSKTTIKAASLPMLDEVAQLMKAHPEVKHVAVEGHTDSMGDPAFNKQLSEGRAKAVRAYLVEKGVAADRLSAKGFGQTKPIADNKTEAGRAANRRVDFMIAQ
jgi:outer membrane protein OmpA-like peptidoglycan-associated protein